MSPSTSSLVAACRASRLARRGHTLPVTLSPSSSRQYSFAPKSDAWRHPKSVQWQLCALFSSKTTLRAAQPNSSASPMTSTSSVNPSATNQDAEDEKMITRFLRPTEQRKYFTAAELEERARLVQTDQEAKLAILKLKRTQARPPTPENAQVYQALQQLRQEVNAAKYSQLRSALQRISADEYQSLLSDVKQRAAEGLARDEKRKQLVDKTVLAHLSKRQLGLRRSLINEQRLVRYLAQQLWIKQRTGGNGDNAQTDSEKARLEELSQQFKDIKARLEQLTKAQKQDPKTQKPTKAMLKLRPHSERTHIGRVSRVGTMRKTIRVSQNKQIWNKHLQKHYTKQTHVLVHDPEEITNEGDVIVFGPFTAEVRQRREQLGKKFGKDEIQFMVHKIVTPFGTTVQDRREKRAIREGDGETAVEDEWISAVEHAKGKPGKRGQDVVGRFEKRGAAKA